MTFKGTSFKEMVKAKWRGGFCVSFRIIPWWFCADKSNFHTMWMWKDCRDYTINYFHAEKGEIVKLPYEIYLKWKKEHVWFFF